MALAPKRGRKIRGALARTLEPWIPAQAPSPHRPFHPWLRMIQDGAHFSVSLWNELCATVKGLPGFLGEVVSTDTYPRAMRFRHLPGDPARGNLDLLRELNPEWPFRPGFDPSRWAVVFLHGYIDNTGADRAIQALAGLGYDVYLVRYPFLDPVARLADQLDTLLREIAEHAGGRKLVPVGHSLGGFIWDHLLIRKPEVARRFQMPLYVPMGSPHFGTLAAHLGVGASARDMLPGSDVVRVHLEGRHPPEMEIYPFVSRFDLLVLPIETALWPDGVNYVFSEIGHIAQVVEDHVVVALEEVFATAPEVLRARAHYRPFFPSTFTWLCSALPEGIQERVGIGGVVRSLRGKNGEGAPYYRIRVVRTEVKRGRFPRLRRLPAS